MNAHEKEEYLREYEILKSQGKPFFPYAVLKDSTMACIVLAVIIGMSIILGAGELANRADPTTVTYTPRPDWYFYCCCRSSTAAPSDGPSGVRSQPRSRSASSPRWRT
jgi:quinol-cytochrome oxidoreductase complex cytochrome b subunit